MDTSYPFVHHLTEVRPADTYTKFDLKFENDFLFLNTTVMQTITIDNSMYGR